MIDFRIEGSKIPLTGSLRVHAAVGGSITFRAKALTELASGLDAYQAHVAAEREAAIKKSDQASGLLTNARLAEFRAKRLMASSICALFVSGVFMMLGLLFWGAA